MRVPKALLSFTLSISMLALPLAGGAKENEITETGHTVKHILLISVDGMHALDQLQRASGTTTHTIASFRHHARPTG
jgi:hypothetical protein